MSVEQKLQLLTRITYKQYLKNYVGAPEEAIVQYQRSSHGLLGAGAQAVSRRRLLDARPARLRRASGSPTPRAARSRASAARRRWTTWSAPEPSRAWPDGNTSLLRLLVSKLIPAAFPDVDGGAPEPGEHRQGGRATTRSSTGRATPSGSGSTASSPRSSRRAAATATPRSSTRRSAAAASRSGSASARAHVVMACWNRVTAHLVDGLPRRQVDDLCYARKVPLIYGRGVLNNWQAWADARISSVSPRGKSLFWDSTSISAGARFGSAYGPTPNEPPAAPASLDVHRGPERPAADAADRGLRVGPRAAARR